MKITRTRGDTYPDQFTIVLKKTGKPADLSNCTFLMTVGSKINPTDNTTMLYQVTGVVNDVTSGVVEFAPTASQANLVGNYFFDVQMIDGQGQIRTLVLDSYTYTQDITK